MARRISSVLTLAVSAALLTCTDTTNVELIEIDATGVLFGFAFVDVNGNAIRDAADQSLKSVPVLLTAGRGSQVIRQASTDTTGLFRMLDVPVGTYSLTLSTAMLGDTLRTVSGGADRLAISRGDTTRVDFGVSYPVLTLGEVRSHPEGRLVFTSGIALNDRLPFGDGAVHLQSDTLYLRATSVARDQIGTGDSLRLLGRTRRDNGQSVLDDVTTTRLVQQATIPLPKELGTGEAALARGGRMDAALARVRAAEISDTATTVGGDFRFRVDDGSGPIEVVLRAFLQIPTSQLRPDTNLRIGAATGLLVPLADGGGNVRWRLLPRGSFDLILETKQADIAIAVNADRTAVNGGDTVTIRVVAINNGPHRATGVLVRDTLPTGLRLLGATSSRGSYTPGTGIWMLDTLGAGASDTLTLRAEAAAGPSSHVRNQACFLGLTKEVDPVLGNNSASVPIAIGPNPPGPPGTPSCP